MLARAVYAYLPTVRPTVHEDQLFLCARAPWRAIRKSNTISGVARKALDRAGVVTHASRGAHVFRHSQATNLLRTGASLDVIQTLLRHESADTTAIYAKTDTVMLAQIAQPWIEEESKHPDSMDISSAMCYTQKKRGAVAPRFCFLRSLSDLETDCQKHISRIIRIVVIIGMFDI